jgi:hypothetical protein
MSRFMNRISLELSAGIFCQIFWIGNARSGPLTICPELRKEVVLHTFSYERSIYTVRLIVNLCRKACDVIRQKYFF